jgi:glutamate/tyrosine decarboxylase-like PLP-dependent enzyme
LSEQLLREAGFEVLSRRLSIVCFRFIPRDGGDDRELDVVNLSLAEAVGATRRVFCTTTRLRGRVYLRFCFVNWRTTTADVEEAVKLLSTLASRA